MEQDEIDWISLAGRKAKGKRPQYFDAPENERMLSILMSLVAEVSVVRERLDTVERLLDERGTISREDIESFEPDRDAAFERGLKTREYIARVMRGVQQSMEAMKESEPDLETVSKDIGNS
ncbi:MAG: hypothetical protein AAGK17_02990 [Pseudomonadota bacterium]